MANDLPSTIRQTADIRFLASQRLQMHQRLSQWTVTFGSVALLVIPLAMAFGLETSLTGPQISVVQVLLAVSILISSLLLGHEDYGLKAHKMHSCGIELNNLFRKSETGSVTGVELAERYHEILSRYDNHADIDYRRYKVKHHKSYYPETLRRLGKTVVVRADYAARFSGYLIMLGLIGYVLLRIFA